MGRGTSLRVSNRWADRCSSFSVPPPRPLLSDLSKALLSTKTEGIRSITPLDCHLYNPGSLPPSATSFPYSEHLHQRNKHIFLESCPNVLHYGH